MRRKRHFEASTRRESTSRSSRHIVSSRIRCKERASRRKASSSNRSTRTPRRRGWAARPCSISSIAVPTECIRWCSQPQRRAETREEPRVGARPLSPRRSSQRVVRALRASSMLHVPRILRAPQRSKAPLARQALRAAQPRRAADPPRVVRRPPARQPSTTPRRSSSETASSRT